MASGEERPDLWTASEFLNSVEPHQMGQAHDASDRQATLVRRADAVAVMRGLGWNQDGAYPMAVWVKAYENF